MRSLKEKNNIGKPLQQAIENSGLSISKFSEEIGINRTLVQGYLSDKKHPSDRTVAKIADYFNLPTEYFTNELYDINKDDTYNILETLANAISNTANNLKIKQYAKEAIKSFNMAINEASYEQQLDMVFKLYEIINEQLCGKTKDSINMFEDHSKLEELENIAHKYNYSHVDWMLLNDRVILSHNRQIIKAKDWNIYKTGFEDGIIASMSENDYYQWSLLEQLKNTPTKPLNQYNEDTIRGLKDLFISINIGRKGYSDAIKTIDELISSLNSPITKPSSHTLIYFNISLKNIKTDIFKIVTQPLIDLLNNNTKSAIKNLISLKYFLSEEIKKEK